MPLQFLDLGRVTRRMERQQQETSAANRFRQQRMHVKRPHERTASGSGNFRERSTTAAVIATCSTQSAIDQQSGCRLNRYCASDNPKMLGAKESRPPAR